jgi:hypothetical protein
VNIVSRADWGARHEDGAGPAPLPAEEVWLHHSVTVAPDLVPPYDDEDAAMRVLEAIGEAKFGRGVSYTFAVMPSGRVFAGHSPGRLGAHTKGRNSRARAIVLVGNYDRDQPGAAQLEATAALLVHGERQGYWTGNQLAGGHRDVPGAATVCPGRHAHALITFINYRAAAIARGATVVHLEEDHMPLTDADVAKIWRYGIAGPDVVTGIGAPSTEAWAAVAGVLGRSERAARAAEAMLTRPGADVDVAALAGLLADRITADDVIERLSPAALQSIAVAVANEEARRMAGAKTEVRSLLAAPVDSVAKWTAWDGETAVDEPAPVEVAPAPAWTAEPAAEPAAEPTPARHHFTL